MNQIKKKIRMEMIKYYIAIIKIVSLHRCQPTLARKPAQTLYDYTNCFLRSLEILRHIACKYLATFDIRCHQCSPRRVV